MDTPTHSRFIIRTAIGGLLLAAGSAGAENTRFTLVDSSGSSWVARGNSDYTVTEADGWSFSVVGDKNSIRFETSGDALLGTSVDFWSMTFTAAVDGEISTGMYAEFERHPFQDPDAPRLNFSSTGRSDSSASGFFQIWEVSYDTNGELLTFAADFTHYGERDLENYAMVELRYNTTVPGPGGAGVLAIAGCVVGCRRRR